MNRQQSILAAHGRTDGENRLVSADEPLAQLQENCGGRLPGALAIPELLELVEQARAAGLRIARQFTAFDGEETVGGYARIRPLDAEEGEGCELLIENWHQAAASDIDTRETAELLDAVDLASAEIAGRLDARQHVQALTTVSADAGELAQAIERQPGRAWSEYVTLQGIAHQQPLHWRLLDGVSAQVPGSERSWRVRLIPVGQSSGAPRGFEWLLVADEPLPDRDPAAEEEAARIHSRLVGGALTPVLRQPIARIIANAETIRARLAGPLRDEYSEYASTIAAAGQHLSAMLDDLADLEVVEAPGFTTAKDRVDLADVAQRAAGILGVRAAARDIEVIVEPQAERVVAIAEFRRLLQILINLIGNAIAYSPEHSTVTITTHSREDDAVAIRVTDQGPGITADQAARIFDKFERLGRDGNDGHGDGGGEGGSGLGLYISHRLAAAMDGELDVLPPDLMSEFAGAVFELRLPAADDG